MSRFVPKFTRPVSDRIDGMWGLQSNLLLYWLVIGDVLVGSLIFFYFVNRVSGDRLLMRQPTLRLGVLIYWIALHALLASFIW